MKLQNFVGDFGRDPVLRSAKLALFCFITQVDTAYQLDTARPRYDDSALFLCRGARLGGFRPFGEGNPQGGGGKQKRMRFVASSRLSSFRHPGVSGPTAAQHATGG